MVINERYNLNLLVCSLDEKGAIENIYYSFTHFKVANGLDKNKKFVVKYQIFDTDLGIAPEYFKNYYDTAEEALLAFDESDDAIY